MLTEQLNRCVSLQKAETGLEDAEMALGRQQSVPAVFRFYAPETSAGTPPLGSQKLARREQVVSGAWSRRDQLGQGRGGAFLPPTPPSAAAGLNYSQPTSIVSLRGVLPSGLAETEES
jgi:hypothetical protein